MCAKIAVHVLLLLSWASLLSLAAQIAQPNDMDCEVHSNHSGDFVRLTWKQKLLGQDIIINYQILWSCSESDKASLFTPTESPCDRNRNCQYDFKTERCFETCLYEITPVIYCAQSAAVTTAHTCHIGKNVPKQAVKVVAAERIGDDGLTIEVTFQVEQLKQIFCDDHMTSAMIKTSSQLFYNTSRIETVDSNEHLFSAIFKLGNALRWKPFNFSLSVSNTIGNSPFTDYIYIKGATNGDLPIHNYTFTVDATETSVSVHWDVSQLPATLLQSQFIAGYTYHLYMPSGVSIADASKNSSHVFNDLEPNQVYYVGSKIITSDTSSWGPDLVLKNISTKGSHRTSHNREVYYLTTISVLSIIVISMVIGVTIRSLKRKYQKRMFDKEESDHYAYNANMSDLSSNPDSFPQEPKSVVESVGTATSTKNAGSVITPGAYVTVSPDEILGVISTSGKQQHVIQQLQQPNHKKSQISFDVRSGSVAVHNNTGYMTSATEHVAVANSASIPPITGQYTDTPTGPFEHVSSTNKAADIPVITGDYTSIPPAFMEHTGTATNANIPVITGQYVDIPSTEQGSATNNADISVITGQYMDIAPASTEQGSTSNIESIAGQYTDIPPMYTEQDNATNSTVITGQYMETTSVSTMQGSTTDNSVITGQYTDTPASTEQGSTANNTVITGQYMDIPPESSEHPGAANNNSVNTGEYVKIPLGLTEPDSATNPFITAVFRGKQPPDGMITSDV